MIVTRTPFRISFAGGGSDLEASYSHQPGAVLCAAIDKYMYLAVKEHFGNTFRVSYSRTEFSETIDGIEHPLVRECLRSIGTEKPLEIVSMADLPAYSGMGSSSSFTVGLLHALHTMRGEIVTPGSLAEEACRIEIEKLGEPIGKQDQYIAAYGGLQFLRFNQDGTVFVDPVTCRKETYRDLNRRLLIFFTGITRNARDVLSRQRSNTKDRLPVLRKLCGIASQLRDVLISGRELHEFGRLLHEAWETKKSLELSITNPSVDRIYERGLRAGALGGKLLGAGGGGFLLFFVERQNQDSVRERLQDLREMPFRLEPQGSKIIYVGG
jgi:D-glycero-alpha-D-manno-heptose-7-phosphate kinase